MGGGHHDLGERMKIPDYTIYKVDDYPELVKFRERLAEKGLKDPWLRNEAWRFNKQEFGPSVLANLRTVAFRGFGLGFGAFLLTIAYETARDHFSNKDDGHH